MNAAAIPNWRAKYKGAKFKLAWPSKKQTITKTCRRPNKWAPANRMKVRFK